MGGGVKHTVTWIVLCFNFAIDRSSETLLLATDNGIKILEPETSETTTVHQYPATSVDFRYNERDIFFTSNNQILYSYFSEFTGSHAEPIPIISAGHRLVGLAVDWRDFKLFYTGGDSGAIYQAALLGATIAPFFHTEGATVTDLALDVFDRKCFYIKDGTLYMTSLYGGEAPSHHFLYHFTTDPRGVFRVTEVAVDHHHRDVYVVGYDEEHQQWQLVSTNYNNSFSTLVFNGSELARPFALGVFDGVVLWGNKANGNYTIYSCKLTPACNIDHLEMVYKSEEAIYDVKFYNELVQTPDPDTACVELACSHNCTVLSSYTVQCSCPPGLTIGRDDNMCIEDAATPISLNNLWLTKLQELLTALTDAFLQWLSSQTSFLAMLILLICAAMLMLLICGLCVLKCTRTSGRSVRMTDGIDLS